MIYESTKANLPIKVWAKPYDVEPDAWDQAVNTANHPNARHHVALMPDVHTGYAVPIGCVVAFQDHLCPSAIGFDIGCGMVALRTSLEEIDTEALKRVCGKAREAVALGEGGRSGVARPQLLPTIDAGMNLPVVERELQSAAQQIGTLGGGK